MLPNGGGVQMLPAQKPINRPDWWKGKFISAVSNWAGGGWWTSVQRPAPSPGPALGKRFYSQMEGATCGNSTVSSDSHLQSGHRWCDQHHLACFTYSSSSLPGSMCSWFFETNSQNCGHLCHGYRLVTMELNFPTWGFTGYGSEYSQ